MRQRRSKELSGSRSKSTTYVAKCSWLIIKIFVFPTLFFAYFSLPAHMSGTQFHYSAWKVLDRRWRFRNRNSFFPTFCESTTFSSSFDQNQLFKVWWKSAESSTRRLLGPMYPKPVGYFGRFSGQNSFLDPAFETFALQTLSLKVLPVLHWQPVCLYGN